MASRKKTAKNGGSAVASRRPLTAAESEAELAAFLELVIGGYSEEDLRRAVAKELRTPLEVLVTEAEKKFRQAGQADPDVVRGFCIEAYREIYRVALAHAEFSVALKALARLEAASRK